MRKTPLKRSSKGLSRGTSTLKKTSSLKSKPKSKEQILQDKEDREKMWLLFEMHWQIKPHICESCGCSIHGENLSLYHDHLLEKGVERYKHLKYEIENLFLVCWECHANKYNNPSFNHKQAIELAKIRFSVS